MPRKKGQSKAQNLGNFAHKCKVQPSDEVQLSKRSRNASPNNSMDNSDNQQTDPSNDSDSDAETEAEIEIQEENDIPHPRDQADLLQWLQLTGKLEQTSLNTENKSFENWRRKERQEKPLRMPNIIGKKQQLQIFSLVKHFLLENQRWNSIPLMKISSLLMWR
ncbi:hypothetical protein K438DRAFT_1775338 [Mycena galopus ATCC 62051]|nr:hypothetical protein K438DRAFT_1775338 [Mycena galopus ATCC 62051]